MYTIFFTIIEFVNFYQLKSNCVNNTVDTTAHHFCNSNKILMRQKDKEWSLSLQKEILHIYIYTYIKLEQNN